MLSYVHGSLYGRIQHCFTILHPKDIARTRNAIVKKPLEIQTYFPFHTFAQSSMIFSCICCQTKLCVTIKLENHTTFQRIFFTAFMILMYIVRIYYLGISVNHRPLKGTKGQLISKCPFGIIVWTKFQQNYFWISALKFFVALLGLPGSLLSFLQASLFMILLTKFPRKIKKLPDRPQEATKKFRAEIQK